MKLKYFVGCSEYKFPTLFLADPSTDPTDKWVDMFGELEMDLPIGSMEDFDYDAAYKKKSRRSPSEIEAEIEYLRQELVEAENEAA